MSHTIYAGSVAKRKNSTLQPTLTASYDVLLKTPTSLHTPTFTISAASFPYNYLKWDDRYYFVTDVTARNNGLWEVSAVVDVLATFKTEILATTAYVLYDSVSNSELPDNRLPMKTTKVVQTASAACPFTVDQGCYILSITGSNNSTGIYKISAGDLAALIDDLSDVYDNLFDYESTHPAPTPPTGSINVSDWVQYWTEWFAWMWESVKYPITQFFGSGDIPQNLRDCRYIPFDVGVTAGPNAIYLGTFQTKQSFGKLLTETVHRSTTVSIPWQASDFRRRSPYTEIYLYLPYIGMTKLSSENLIGQSSVTVDYTLAMRDGGLICTISSGGEILGQYSGNVGASVPVGVSNVSLPKVAGSMIAGVGAALTGTGAAGAAAVGMAALNFQESITPNFSCIGGLDGIAAIGAEQNIICYTVFHDTIAAPNQNLQVIGAPTMCSKALATLTGFCQCLDAHVAAAGEAQELEELDNFLNSGFYIE